VRAAEWNLQDSFFSLVHTVLPVRHQLDKNCTWQNLKLCPKTKLPQTVDGVWESAESFVRLELGGHLVWFGKSHTGVQQRAVVGAVASPSVDGHPFWMSEPGSCAMKTQPGSTNSKGLPVLFQWLSPRNAAE